MKKVLISSCLLGECVKYSGGHNKIENSNFINFLYANELLLPVCPEVDGGLPTPRPPSEIEPGFSGFDVLSEKAKVINIEDKDVTFEFIEGAKKALHVAKEHNVKMAIFKASSPSCGNKTIYDGTHSGSKKSGEGVCAALLREKGIKVFNEKELDDAENFWNRS